MEQEKVENNRGSSLLKSVIEESRKIRADRGEDFFTPKHVIESTSKIHSAEDSNLKNIIPEKDFKNLRESHIKLAHLIVDYDKKIFEKNNQVLTPKKTRSKSIHLYIDENIEHFLIAESKKSQTKWGLRKNAGIGQLIQKFIENFIKLKKREERQLVKVKKIIDDFRSNLVEFKKASTTGTEYQKAELINQKMKVLSNDLRIILSLLEFEEDSLKSCLQSDQFLWIDFIVKWKYQS
jgi:hypothetical protein